MPDSDRTKALRALTQARKDLVRTRVALANQLRGELACFWPGASKVFCAVDSPIALAFLRRYPSPAGSIIVPPWDRWHAAADGTQIASVRGMQ
ncbi:MAG: hypothetical protein ACXVH3_32645 [Solirubrobacteraceae bacterium]